MIAFGTLPDQSSCQDDPKVGMEALYLNGLLAVIYCEILISKMREIKYSKLAIIGSVAGDRGRKSNYFYGAAKSMIDTFVRGAQHRLKFSSSPLKLIIIKPGPTISPMTESLETSLNLADPKVVARQIVKGIDKNKSVIYAPAKWRLIMMVLKKIPSFIFNKIDL
mgnify:CR=1 FL=1